MLIKEQFKAIILHTIYHNSDNAYTVLKVKNKSNGSFVAAGIFPEFSDVGETKAEGLSVLITGKWVKHKKYGMQFAFEKAEFADTGLLFFLTHIVKGIGEKLAKKLIEHYGEQNLEFIIDNTPEKLTEFKGIKEKKLKKIVNSWNKYKQIKGLTKFFASHNVDITSTMILKIFKHFHSKEKDPILEIKRNPYVLTDIRGIGFKTCDKIALQIGIEKDSPFRYRALADYIFLKAAKDEGHTYLTVSQFIERASEELNKEPDQELADSFGVKVFFADTSKYYVSEDGEKVALLFYKRKEEDILNRIYSLKKAPFSCDLTPDNIDNFISMKERELGFALSSQQRKAITDIFTNRHKVFVLCGYAGTGKSTISKIILDLFAAFIPKDKITCCAFTGMASKRIRDLTGYKSSTIHSLLGFDGSSFKYNDKNPLPYKVVLLDEASMVNVDMFHALVKALPKDAVFVMVGDDAQLPPIGAGNVFSDLLKYNDIPKVKLTKIYRQSSNSVITYFANKIRKGEIPDGYWGTYDDWEFHKMDINGYFKLKKELSEKELKEVREKHYTEMLNEMLKQIDKVSVDMPPVGKIWNIQVITAMKKTILGTKNLNEILQDRLNPYKSTEIKNRKLKLLDKVIHLKNQDMPFVYKSRFKKTEYNEPEGKIRIFNGALGLVRAIDKENGVFYVQYPDYNDILIEYDFDDYGDIIDLGYALTIHKTQGSQFNYVFIPIINSFYVMLNSKLIYTAITRTVEKVFIYAQKYAFEKSCKNIVETRRQTFLSLKQNATKYK